MRGGRVAGDGVDSGGAAVADAASELDPGRGGDGAPPVAVGGSAAVSAVARVCAVPDLRGAVDLGAAAEDAGIRVPLAKRYDDTDLILREITECGGLGSDRGKASVARLNEIHGAYAIKNDDLVYTLSAFVLEPSRFFERYGWRPLTAGEKADVAAFWIEVGTAMKLRDIPPTFEAFEAFNVAFEEAKFRFAPSNRVVADATVKLMTRQLAFLEPCVVALLDEPLRIALGYPPAPRWLRSLLETALTFRALAHRHLTPPRLFAPVRRTPPSSHSSDPCKNGDTANARFFPLFSVYGRAYAKSGYTIATLGPEAGLLGSFQRPPKTPP
eukprot:CAMPEP_0118901976 /NCGR_PEP_ID=MMETSP1166-20130328/7464_1 /TAXON_ID=1104430 /ORGANISM="Chrysoreinhardia sp, Strain CCMP3193" /LENGTH=326 /DNA_ID=CAMNT_0006841171 /DNA_START=82 /DNA_END=1063 /DNA_ORIENTATION=-